MTDYPPVSLPRLMGGGLIVTYACPSRCAHCLYMCGPRRDHAYVDLKTARANLRAVRRLGCRSMHIGGGEPFLNVDRLESVLRVAHEEGVYIEYVETNAAWYTGHHAACATLEKMKRAGLSTLLISISPFHAEYIPLAKTKGLIRACRATGMEVFPWIPEFLDVVGRLDETERHALVEYADVLGPRYLEEMVRAYHLTPGGRALALYKSISEPRPLAAILAEGAAGCARLTSTSHFHIDNYGNYILGLCTGLAIARDDLDAPLDPRTYPVLTRLYHEGAAGLFAWAADKHEFEPASEYVSPCALCADIRGHLARRNASAELAPREFYASCEYT